MYRIALFLKVVVFAFFLSVFLRYFFVQPFVVADAAMMPEFEKGDIVLVTRSITPRRDTLIVFRDEETGIRSLRRVVAIPGEHISVADGIISIVDNEDKRLVKELPLFGTVALTLPGVGKVDAHEVFVMPDRPIESFYGLIDVRHIIGAPFIRIYPFSKVKIFNN